VIRDKRRVRATGPPARPKEGQTTPAPDHPEQAEPHAEPGDGSGTGTEAQVAGQEPVTAEPEPAVTGEEAPGGFAAELAAVRAELDERTRDLQRVSAEYANYRKRVDRDRALVNERATANVISALLPVLDDLDRAREHGELAEGVSAVIDQLATTTAKFGLAPFGEKGDPFDPNRHEAVAHQRSPDVSEPTCVEILRRGYLLGDRLLRPAMVAVADPE
jgi:molecular chaperone GrpE